MKQKNPHNERIQYTDEDVKIFKENNCEKLLEIFFGDGRNMIKFAKDGFEVEGIDDGIQNHNDYAIKGLENIRKKGLKGTIIPIFETRLNYADE